MNHLQAIRVFLKVAECGSFGRAATSFELSNAVITRYVALLEAHLNTRLLNRTTRSVSLTEAGHTYALACKTMLDQLEEIEAAISRSSTDPSGTLRLVASASFSLLCLTPLLVAYRARYPNVKVRLTLLHRPVDLVDEGFDVGIVVPRLVNSGTLINRPLFKVTPVVVAAPAYLALHGTPERPMSLMGHTFIAPSPDIHGATWTFATPSGDDQDVFLDPAYTVNNSQMLRQAVISAMGVAILPESHVANDIESGALVRLLPDFPVKDADKEVSLVYPGRRHVSAKTRSFVDFTLAFFRSDAAGSLLPPIDADGRYK